MSRYTNPVPQYPVANGKLFFYESEQNVLKSTFADQPQTILNTNPVLLDSAGRTPNIYYTGTARVVLTDCNSLQVWERDPVGGENAFADFGQWLSYITYDVNDIVEVSNNFYLSKTIANQGNDPSVTPGSNANWTLINFLGLFNTSTTYSVGSIVNTSNGKIWASVVNSNLNNDPITDVDGDYWTSSVSVPIRKTTEGLILSSEIFATGVIIETSGYAASADGGAGSWKQNGFVGQTASQSPLQLGAALLNDAAGNQWALIINGPVSAVALGPGATAAVASVSTFGTAANADVTVSTTDETTGRLLKVDDFGIAQPILIPLAQDLDTYITTGDYYQEANNGASAGTNYPIGRAGLLQVRVSNDEFFHQKYTEYTNLGVFRRTLRNTIWTEWVKEFDTGNTNFNVFGGLAADDRIVNGFALSATSAVFNLPINSFTSPGSFTKVSTFKVLNAAAATIATDVTLSFSTSSTGKNLVLTAAVTGRTTGEPLVLLTETATSKITVNF
jgi:hypothetical protein